MSIQSLANFGTPPIFDLNTTATSGIESAFGLPEFDPVRAKFNPQLQGLFQQVFFGGDIPGEPLPSQRNGQGNSDDEEKPTAIELAETAKNRTLFLGAVVVGVLLFLGGK